MMPTRARRRSWPPSAWTNADTTIQLSGGEQQRVALARALAPNPAILIADEPTGNLDETTGLEIIELLFAGHEQRGTTLVLVTHDAALAARCDRVVRLRSGRIEDAPRRDAVKA